MAFNDDDFERLKEYYGVGHGDEPMIEALLARLEAAEAIARYAEKYAPINIDPLNKLIKAWRTAAGRDGKGE